jgi:uncharacterized protein
MLIGTLAAARRYPVKSLRGEILDRVEIERDGIAGDRTSALFVRSGHARAGKAYRGKEHERLHLFDEVAPALAAAAERGVELEVRDGDRFFDAAPISVLVDRWLGDLSAHLGYEVEWERFRPNLFVRAAPGFAVDESGLCDAELELGSARLRVRERIERCVTPTYHPRGDAADPELLRYVAARRENCMGIYCDVLQPGNARVGDQLKRRR